MSEVITTRTAKVWLDDEGIIRDYDLPDLEHDLADAMENVAAYARVAKGVPRPVFADMKQVRGLKRTRRGRTMRLNLSLAVGYQMLHRNGAEIMVESADGTTFRILFPS